MTKYTVATAWKVIEADSRLEAVEEFCNSKVVIVLEELIQEEQTKRGHEFIRELRGCRTEKEAACQQPLE